MCSIVHMSLRTDVGGVGDVGDAQMSPSPPHPCLDIYGGPLLTSARGLPLNVRWIVRRPGRCLAVASVTGAPLS